MAEKKMDCVVCGASNAASLARCDACGAKLEPLVAGIEGPQKGHASLHQGPFDLKWVLAATASSAVVLGILLVALPLVIRTYDPQGLPGLLIADAVLSLGGFLVGLRSRGRTYLEPIAAAALVVGAVVPYVASISDVRALDTFGYVTAGFIGILGAGLGAYLGERVQGDRAVSQEAGASR